MVSSFLPYPLFSGGQVRLYNLIKELSIEHEITLVCEKRNNQTEKDVKELEKICKKVIVVERRKQWSFENLLKTASSSHSFLTTGHTNYKLKDKIKQELNGNNFDLIHVETFYVIQNLPQTILPIILAEHNIEYQVYSRYVDQASSVIKPLLSLDIEKIKKEEEEAWKKATKMIAVSNEDKRIIEQKNLHTTIVANGVDTEKFSFKKKKSISRILFLGDFKWIQNRDAVTFIIKEIWPLINSELKMKLWIVGRKIPNSIRKLTNDSNIIFDEDSSGKPTEELFQKADILLAPIRIGGGTSYKILESMSCGTPVVTTPLSAGALGVKDGQELIVGKNASELAEKTMRLLQDKKLYKKIAKNGRKLIEEKYTWKEIVKKLNEVYKSAV